ncbi:SGNH/GDSL hydrolase family protein [Fredinandcohnia sp. 179-A 10B2 NHS]|uniref:SGNH/GDSL hydrolase family protein n=1 Tax=Fredinandcohnia sp. 179-A 10B2 NHS TaxID=3235176 RepID=UPI0039A395FD
MWYKERKLSILFLLVLLMNAFVSPMVFAEEVTVDKPSLVALGDSITFGWNLYEGENPDKTKPSSHAFPNYILGGGFEVTNLSYPGWTSTQLLEKFTAADPTYLTAIAQADVITLNIGNNDFLQLPEIMDLRSNPRPLSESELMALKGKIVQTAFQLGENLKMIFQGIRSVNNTAPIVFYNMYNPFEAKTNPVLHTLGKTLINGEGEQKGINELVYLPFGQIPGTFLVDAYSAFEGKQDTFILPFPDVHPTIAGQKALASLADQVLYQLFPPELKITLTPTPTESTEGPVTIAVETNQEELLEIKWLPGQLEVKDFEENGNEIEVANPVFEVTENGFYTVYVLSGFGEEKVQTIEITNIIEPEEEPPAEEEPPVEEEPPAEEMPPVKEEPVKEDPKQTPDKQAPDKQKPVKSGNKLPDTASSNYNLLVAGVSLLLVGSGIFFIYVRKNRIVNS